MPTVLLTGATGYIASHTWLALQGAGFDVVGVDDFSNSSPEVLNRLRELGGRAPVFEQANVCDEAAMEQVFQRHAIDATVHFAALKAVGESGSRPVDYYANNLGGLLTTCRVMQRHGVKRFVFSSSATVYGDPQQLPIREDAPLSATNPYGRTKLMGEQMLLDLAASDPAWQNAILRYFNPVGAHASGRIGEDPRGIPNNLMPYVAQVAVGQRRQQRHEVEEFLRAVERLAHLGAPALHRLHAHSAQRHALDLGLGLLDEQAHRRVAPRRRGHRQPPRDAARRLDQAGGLEVGGIEHHPRRETREAAATVGLDDDDAVDLQRHVAEQQRIAHLQRQRIEHRRVDPHRTACRRGRQLPAPGRRVASEAAAARAAGRRRSPP